LIGGDPAHNLRLSNGRAASMLPHMRMLVLLLLLAACGRPLSPAETAFAGALFGPETAAPPVSFRAAAPVGAVPRTYPTRPRTTCREKILPPNDDPTFEARTAGVTLWTHVITNPDWYAEDYLAGWPERMNLVAAMFFAHEMTHVWQWKNRAQTRFTPLRAGLEHVRVTDPYLFETGGGSLLDYPYEQQASLVEEYVCCVTLDPGGARTERLRALLSEHLPLRELPRARAVLLPWPEAPITGMCA